MTFDTRAFSMLAVMTRGIPITGSRRWVRFDNESRLCGDLGVW
jgi:hypothetical protein